MSRLFEHVLLIVRDVCTAAEATIAKMAGMRKQHSSFPNSLFPNDDEMRILSEEAKSKIQSSLGDRLISLMPSHVIANMKSNDLRILLIEQIVASAVYPDLLQRNNTAERIATAICDLMEGNVTVLIVTGIRGVYTKIPFKLDQSIVRPMPRSYLFWLTEQLYGVNSMTLLLSHAFLLTERRVPYSSITEGYSEEEPTAQELQALRLATNSEVLSLGSIMRSVVFNLISPSSPFGFGFQWWPAKRWKASTSSTILTEEHIEEAGYLLQHVRSNDGPLSLAIRRFDLAINRTDERDRLVDLTIAAESLLLTKDERDNQTYRLKMRGARLVYPDGDRPDKSRWLNEVYKLRSKIVHGDRLSEAEKRSAEDKSIQFAEFVRHSIRRSARLVDNNCRNIPEMLDNALLGAPGATNIVDRLGCPSLPTDQIEAKQIFLD